MTKRGYKEAVRGVENERIGAVVDAFVHSDRDREIIKLNLIHGISYTMIADVLHDAVSPRTVQAVMNRWAPMIIEKLKR